MLSSKDCECKLLCRDPGSISLESAAEMISAVFFLAILVDIFKNIFAMMIMAALAAAKAWICMHPVIGFLLGGFCRP